jgi:hypothetical protein
VVVEVCFIGRFRRWNKELVLYLAIIMLEPVFYDIKTCCSNNVVEFKDSGLPSRAALKQS